MLGPYEILSAIGAGGMGEVYRAKDTRLDRTVAVKILLGHVAERTEARERFEREARTISSLNHPNICTLFDVGTHEGLAYLVMEHLEGETLASRLEKGALSVDQALKISIEIASALDRAHRSGVVHRDLKPGNIILTKSGAKLLDFGLAKLTASEPAPAAAPGARLSTLRTEHKDLTAEGTILGTFQYMAPEQLEGKEADARTDVFAFGAVVYEMATGRRAFTGKSQASLIASILAAEPPSISSIQPMTPPALDRLVKRCLAKEPDERWQSAADLASELRWVAEGGSQTGLPAPIVARRTSRETIWRATAVGLGLSTISLVVLLFYAPAARRAQNQREPARAIITQVLAPEKTTFHLAGFGGGFGAGPVVISPDGRSFAFGAAEAGRRDRIWVRALDAVTARPLEGTEGAAFPFWSGDGAFIGFFADSKLKKIGVSGGPAVTICDAPDGRGGAWNSDGTILFEPIWNSPILKVSASGGKPEPVTTLDPSRDETTHRWPYFLPDGRHFLYIAGSHRAPIRNDVDAIYVASLDPNEPRRLLVAARSNPVYSDGHLFFVRDKTLMAQPFDASRLELTGDPIPIAENVTTSAQYFSAVFSVSGSLLAYQGKSSGADLSKLVWSDRTGKQLGTIGDPGEIATPRISPDGRRVAYTLGDPGDVWLYDTTRKVATRFTFDPANDENPVWSPDGGLIAFASSRKWFADLWEKPATSAASETILAQFETISRPSDWSRDGKLIALTHTEPKTRMDIDVYSIADRKMTPFLVTEFEERDARYSPDGRWIAYESIESGNREVYIEPFPGPGGKVQVSTAGGSTPVWRPDGREIFYVATSGKMMAAEIKPGSTFEVGQAMPLFDVQLKQGADWAYDIAPDGERFLLNIALQEEAPATITLVQNWTARLKR